MRLDLLGDIETKPLLLQKEEEVGFLKGAWRVSRRYSIVASEVSLLALNIIFLIAKADEEAPKELGSTTLFLLSAIGILFLHYPLDVIWKSVQDTRFALKVKNYPIATLALVKALNQTSNVALTIGGFAAATEGLLGYEEKQMNYYHDVTLWGEISLGVGLAVTGLSTLVTYLAKRQIKKGNESEPFIATIRYCMDKDTLWHLIDKLKKQESSVAIEKIVTDNIDTQLKVTLGGQIFLIIIGDSLQAVEKVYTPNSLVSAVINCSVSTCYAIKIVIEKGLEYRQRARLDVASTSLQ